MREVTAIMSIEKMVQNHNFRNSDFEKS